MAETSQGSKQDWLLFIGLFCFFFSGAAGLVYQVVWTRMLTQIFGNTTYAIATVLSAFMAGLAIGSYLFGQIADRGKNDFLLYGILEAGVGVYGFLVPWFFAGAQKLYGPIFGLNESYPFIFNLVLFFLSFVLLVFPTLLMGATLPVLSRFFVRSFAQFGRRVGDLYATNTLGAVIGCAAAGFFFIPTLGMRMTVFVAAGVNLVIALLILLVDRVRDKELGQIPLEPQAAEQQATAEGETASSLRWIVLGSFALSGFASLVYENAWTRALTLVIGSSIYSFTTMLVTFLIGLALGGFIYARFLGQREPRLSSFGLIEMWVGLAALATIPLFERLPLIFVRLLNGCVLVASDPKLTPLPRAMLGAAVLILAVLVPFKVQRWDQHILTSGVTIYNDRYESLPSESLRIEEMKRDDVIFYREGLTTTVSVHRIPGSDYLYFKSNGKIDGSYGDALSQLMTSYIPMLLHPKAEVALTIGLGSGMSAKALATFDRLKEIEVIEIEPTMVEASKFFDRASVKLEKLP